MDARQCKVVILCGGKGVRLSAYSESLPKPLVQIGGKPIIWHVMKLYSHYGFRDFILALGYKGDRIVDYFEHYKKLHCDNTISLNKNKQRIYRSELPPDERDWSITFAHTGEDTMTGGRLKRIEQYIDSEDFLLTYADGVSNVDIGAVHARHLASGNDLTMVTVEIASNFGLVETENDRVVSFQEKPRVSVRINGGFFACSRRVFEHLEGDETVFEETPIRTLVTEGKVGAFEHDGFWACMDTPKDYQTLDKLWHSGNPPWKLWDR